MTADDEEIRRTTTIIEELGGAVAACGAEIVQVLRDLHEDEGSEFGDVAGAGFPAFERLNVVVATLPLAALREALGAEAIDRLVTMTEKLGVAIAERVREAGGRPVPN